jgi:transposase-like protein
MRKQYTPQFKAKVIHEILREEKSISQLSAQYGVHAPQLRKWKRRGLEKLSDLFVSAERTDAKLTRLQKEQEQLYAEIGKLTTQLNWLKKRY